MSSYYSDHLSAQRLQRCYELAPPRVRQYLEAEVQHVVKRIKESDLVLELGCGYGRILPALAEKAKRVVGIDTSISSLRYGRELLDPDRNCILAASQAAQLCFPDRTFDVVVCVQNGVSAFHVDQRKLIGESIRVTKSGGMILFSTYSEKFWNDRMQWFRLQAEAGLLGEIDGEKTKDGVIVCKDGFSATTVSADRFLQLTDGLDVDVKTIEVDASSLFCEMIRRK